ncbi:MAG: phenylalanine--tRNA ligase subunit alpha [Rubrobacter sp.]|nr:phenylalanine--tRNA ligase subunit alpha [Rubrobacter sp.]
MTEIEHILRLFAEVERRQNPLEEAQKALNGLEEAQRAQDPLKTTQRALGTLEDAQRNNPLEEAQRTLEALEKAQGVQNPLEAARRALKSLEEVNRLVEDAWASIESAQTLAELEQLRIEYLGRSAALTEMKKSIRELPVELRPQIGGAANRASRSIEAILEARGAELTAVEREERLRAEAVDVTLPGTPYPKGSLHPSQRVIDELVDFFVGLGYRVAEGPEVETDYYNFTALSIPPGHPARGMQDTFFLDEGLVLRTHTSPVQVRTMLSQEPPVYIVCPGRVYRRDSDPTHTPMFNQVEGLAVDRGLTMGHLKGTLTAMARHVFGEAVRLRLRPSYFQFTEPSVEMDVSCFVCDGEDPNCKVCKGAGWLEMGGAGMVDPAVFEEVGYDPEEYTGFAFGMGPDRMAMVKYDIPDLRLFFEGDLRFLRQF